jgi:hypothetical protein
MVAELGRGHFVEVEGREARLCDMTVVGPG